MSRFAACLGALAVALALAASPSAGQTRFKEPGAPCNGSRFTGRAWLGIMDLDLIKTGPNFRDCEYARFARMRVGIVREVFYWSGIELTPRHYTFYQYDQIVASAARHGIHLLAGLVTTPTFYSSAPAGTPASAAGFYPPKHPADMARFAAAVVRRYGTHGSFWRQYPALPRVPVRLWQVYNEPNYRPYWPTGPNARQFTRLIDPVARAMHRADRRARVVGPGMPFLAWDGVSPERFTTQMLRWGAGRWVDDFAIHPYSHSPGASMAFIRRFRRALDRAGARKKGIWITEVGWASGGDRFAPSPRGQARFVTRFLGLIARERTRWRIRGLIHFEWRDRPRPSGMSDRWALHLGLLDSRSRPKPTLRAFASAAQRIYRGMNPPRRKSSR